MFMCDTEEHGEPVANWMIYGNTKSWNSTYCSKSFHLILLPQTLTDLDTFRLPL